MCSALLQSIYIQHICGKSIILQLLNVITRISLSVLSAMAGCISLMIGRLGSVVGANIAGALMGQYCEWNFYIACGAMYACGFLVLLLPRKSPEAVAKSEAWLI